jgi:hypothetical protein
MILIAAMRTRCSLCEEFVTVYIEPGEAIDLRKPPLCPDCKIPLELLGSPPPPSFKA